MRWITWTPRQKNTINFYFFKADFYGSTCIFWLFSASILSYHASYFFQDKILSCFPAKKSTRFSDALLPDSKILVVFLIASLFLIFSISCPNSTPQSHHTDTQTPLSLPHLHESARNTISEILSHPPRAAGTGEVPPHRQTALHTPSPQPHPWAVWVSM